MLETVGSMWNPACTQGWGPRIRDRWSVGLCDDVAPGTLFGKPFPECTEEEIRQEIWHLAAGASGRLGGGARARGAFDAE